MAALLVLLLSIGFTGCGQNTNENNTDDTEYRDDNAMNDTAPGTGDSVAEAGPVEQAGRTDTQAVNGGAVADREFERMFRKLAVALKKQDMEAIGTYIHPQKGFYIVERPGAIDKIIKARSMGDFNKEIYKGSTRLNNLDCPLNFRPLPEVDCNRTYAVCVAAPTDTFNRLSTLKAAFDRYGFKDNAKGISMEELKKFEKDISMSVLSDAIVISFFRENDKWYIGVIDLSKYSCSA